MAEFLDEWKVVSDLASAPEGTPSPQCRRVECVAYLETL